MSIRVIAKSNQAYGAFNGGQIIENKPIGFPQDGGFVRPYSNLFYWARAKALIDSTIGLHPHQGFEIMSFVLEGKIRHYDSKMDAWKELEAGSAQIIRAGSGIKHAEHMEKGAVMFQIWVDPNLDATLQKEATYNDYNSEQLHREEKDGNIILSYNGENGPLELDAPGLIFQRWNVSEKITFEVKQGEILSLYTINGNGNIDGETVEKDDFVIIDEPGSFDFIGKNLDLFVIRAQEKLPYRTYSEKMAARKN